MSQIVAVFFVWVQVAVNFDRTTDPWITKPALYPYTMGDSLLQNVNNAQNVTNSDQKGQKVTQPPRFHEEHELSSLKNLQYLHIREWLGDSMSTVLNPNITDTTHRKTLEGMFPGIT